jgi:hypothetical protein
MKPANFASYRGLTQGDTHGNTQKESREEEDCEEKEVDEEARQSSRHPSAAVRDLWLPATWRAALSGLPAAAPEIRANKTVLCCRDP